MGFGFNLLFILFILPTTCILLIFWLILRKPEIGRILLFIWGGIFIIYAFTNFANWLKGPTQLDQEDYYGSYVINRDYFKGKQTDWQYNHFRFEITPQDSIYFYETHKEKIINTYKGIVETTQSYKSARLIIKTDTPTHHILSDNPTTYRKRWSFYLVFNSPKFHNVFFKKGTWEPID